jgi:tryptophanase
LRSFEPRSIIEPFRIRSVESIHFSSYERRATTLAAAGYNPFQLRSEDVLIDLLTDSGTGAMSSRQWAEMMASDESYAGARSFYRFESTVREITGYRHVLPTHQGRAAEHILMSALVTKGSVVPNNAHFDTTRAHVEHAGGEARDVPITEASQPQALHPFKGNMDIDALDRLVHELGPAKIPLIMLTVTNDSGGGQAVSFRECPRGEPHCTRPRHSVFP